MRHENPLEIFPYGEPPLPAGKLGKLTPPPSPLENLIPSVGLVWIFSGTTHCICKFSFTLWVKFNFLYSNSEYLQVSTFLLDVPQTPIHVKPQLVRSASKSRGLRATDLGEIKKTDIQSSGIDFLELTPSRPPQLAPVKVCLSTFSLWRKAIISKRGFICGRCLLGSKVARICLTCFDGT